MVIFYLFSKFIAETIPSYVSMTTENISKQLGYLYKNQQT